MTIAEVHSRSFATADDATSGAAEAVDVVVRVWSVAPLAHDESATRASTKAPIVGTDLINNRIMTLRRSGQHIGSAVGSCCHDGDMEQRVSFITLAVADVAASHRFYAEGLGWEPEFYDPADVLMFRAGPQTVLSLWDRGHFEAEIGAPAQSGPGVVPITLSHNVLTSDEVDSVLADARAAGATEVSDGAEREWGGYTGYFADPDGFRWEIAWNPGPVGQLVLPPVADAT